jgi:hypothetical protein
VISEQVLIIQKKDDDSGGNDGNDNLVAGINPDFCMAIPAIFSNRKFLL